MANTSNLTVGTVFLIGAGPGDPGLITLRGVQCLNRADVILYDYLVNPRLLQHAKPTAERICLGRHGQGRILSQDEINRELVELARQGKTVARLKSGDPAVFARGAEEAEHLGNNGIAYEIIPGITAALAAGSYAGIPITHRDRASAVALVTGQESPSKDGQSLDYRALANFPGTLVFYMGVTTADSWTAGLIAAGKPPETPVAIIRRCSFPDQLSIRCRLDEVTKYLSPSRRLRPPAIVIIGEVVNLADTLSWFERRPLFGQSILVTRPAGQANDLVASFEEQGAAVHVQPAIQIEPLDSWTLLDNAIDELPTFDWLVFSSANGVRHLFQRLFELDLDLRVLAGVRIAAIGPGTAGELAQFHLRADLLPDQFRAESLAAALSEDAKGKNFLLIRASRGREVLAEQINAAGGRVQQVVAYNSRDVAQPEAEISAMLSESRCDWVTVTSSAIARSLAQMFGQSLKNCRLASISPITSATLRQLGYEPATEAVTYTMDGVVEAIVRAVTNESANV